jgi:16S rRNA (guanine966-N2)-methyltransferase
MHVMMRSGGATQAKLPTMRVVAGSAKGRRLVAPKGDATRPTSDFVREAIFNSLQALVDWPEATVVDLFAGTGALGIEALSRGAAACTFVDRDPRAIDAIRRNLATTGLTGATVVTADVAAWLARARQGFTVVFADPPYSFDEWSIVGRADAELIVAESDRDIEIGAGWAILRSRRYGGTVVTLFERSPDGGPRTPSPGVEP